MPGESRGEGEEGGAQGRGLQVGEMCGSAQRPVRELRARTRERRCSRMEVETM